MRLAIQGSSDGTYVWASRYTCIQKREAQSVKLNWKLRNLAAASLAIVVVGTGVAAAAKLSPADAVATRRSNFRDLGASFKVITDELKKAEPDKPTIERAAMEVHDFGKIQGGLFEKGTGKDSEAPTRAKDEIWADPKAFAAQQAAFAA